MTPPCTSPPPSRDEVREDEEREERGREERKIRRMRRMRRRSCESECVTEGKEEQIRTNALFGSGLQHLELHVCLSEFCKKTHVCQSVSDVVHFYVNTEPLQ